jgi:hypothetical protein
MKNYKAALLALEQGGTPTAKRNKFAKIAIDTTDVFLKEHALRVSKMYSHFIKGGWSRDTRDANGVWSTTRPSTNPEWRTMQKVVNNELRAYVEMRIAESKPEWQVMAEKYGWKPPY